MRIFLLSLMTLVFLAAWLGLFFYGNEFLDAPQWARLSLSGLFVAIYGSLMWYFRPRDS